MGMSFSAGDSFTLNIRGTYQVKEGRFFRIDIEMR